MFIFPFLSIHFWVSLAYININLFLICTIFFLFRNSVFMCACMCRTLQSTYTRRRPCHPPSDPSAIPARSPDLSVWAICTPTPWLLLPSDPSVCYTPPIRPICVLCPPSFLPLRMIYPPPLRPISVLYPSHPTPTCAALNKLARINHRLHISAHSAIWRPRCHDGTSVGFAIQHMYI